MKGKNGNLIIILREGEAISLDGPGKVLVKQLRRNKVAVLVNADNETNVKRESKEVTEKHKGEKE